MNKSVKLRGIHQLLHTSYGRPSVQTSIYSYMQLSGCWLERDLRLLDLSVFVVGSRLTFRGFPSVTRADAIARPAETTCQHSRDCQHSYMQMSVYLKKNQSYQWWAYSYNNLPFTVWVDIRYSLVVWGGTTAGHLDRILLLQKGAGRMVSELGTREIDWYSVTRQKC